MTEIELKHYQYLKKVAEELEDNFAYPKGKSDEKQYNKLYYMIEDINEILDDIITNEEIEYEEEPEYEVIDDYAGNKINTI